LKLIIFTARGGKEKKLLSKRKRKEGPSREKETRGNLRSFLGGEKKILGGKYFFFLGGRKEEKKGRLIHLHEGKKRRNGGTAFSN